MTVFVTRNDAGKVIRVYMSIQPGVAEDQLEDSHPDLVEFREINTVYVRRRDDGSIEGYASGFVEGVFDEEMQDTDPEFLAFLARPLGAADFQRAIEAHIEATAKARQYSSAVSCASYAASNNPAWQAEALAFIAWRDAVWVYAFAELAKVESQEREPPASVEAFIAELPPIPWLD